MEVSYPAKIQRPASSGIVVRKRLISLIDRSSDKRIYWISGPGGAGKTTLINSYVEERHLPCVWYQVDESDNDLAGFFYYLGRAAQFISANHEVVFPSFTPEYTFGLPEFSRSFFSQLSEILEPDTCLVLDNCQEIPDDADLYRAILSGMSQLGVSSRVVFISRNELAAPLYRSHANNEVCSVGWQDLRLTVEEVEAFSIKKNLRFDSDQIERLHTLLDGWAAGFQIMAGTDNIGAYLNGSSQTISEDSKESIFNYFAEDIFRHLENTSQSILLKTSVLPYLDVSLLEELTGSSRAADVIKELCRTNGFISRQINHPSLYSYHQLFKEFLQNRYRSISSDAEIRKTLDDAASLFISHGKIEEGISLYIQAGNWSEVIALIIESGQTLLGQGRFRTLLGWLQSIPDDIARNDPWVYYWTAVCLMLQEPDKAQRLFDKSLAMFRQQRNVVGMYLTLSGMGESLAYRFDSYIHYDQWIELVEQLRRQHSEFPSVEIEARMSLMMMTAIGLRQPSYPHADEWRSRAMALVNNNELEGPLRIHIINSLILERTLTGHLNEADILISIFKNFIEDQTIPPIVLINLKNFEALLNWRRSRPEECMRAATEGLAIAEKTGVHVISTILLLNGVAGALSSGNLEQAEKLISTVEPQLGRTGVYGKLLYHFNMAWKYFLENAMFKAAAQCEQALILAAAVGNPEAIAISYLTHAILFLANGEFSQSESELEKAIEICEIHPIHQVAFGCHLTKAELYFSVEKHGEGIKALQIGLGIGSKFGFNNFPIWRHEAISELCVKALASEIQENYIQWLIEERSLFPQRPPVHLENWPWEVKIYCLGDFKLVIKNEAVKFKGKTQQKPIDLLKALIALGGKNVSESKLSDILWPDVDGDMQRQSFNTTLHRLRKILKAKDILELNSGQLSLNEKKCWIDVWAFNDLQKNSGAYQISRKKNEDAAISLYQGPFLQNETGWWYSQTRDRLQRQFLSALEQAAKGCMERSLWKNAADLYEKGLEIEASAAEFYIQLVYCYSKLGHKASALRIQGKYKEEFDVKNDPVFHTIQRLYHEMNGAG